MNDTREYIIDKAFELFIDKSYEAVSISDISAAIGFTKGALYHHFTNKEELFKAVIDKYLLLEGIEADIEKITFREYTELHVKNIQVVINRIFGNKTQFVPINCLTFIADGFRHYEGFAESKKNFFNAEICQLEVVLENAIKRGEIRNDINTKAIALTYFSNAIGLAGNLLQNYSIDESISLLKAQYDELYRLLKV